MYMVGIERCSIDIRYDITVTDVVLCLQPKRSHPTFNFCFGLFMLWREEIIQNRNRLIVSSSIWLGGKKSKMSTWREVIHCHAEALSAVENIHCPMMRCCDDLSSIVSIMQVLHRLNARSAPRMSILTAQTKDKFA